MSLVYILDGYNIIKRTPQLNIKKLKDSRIGLIKYIQTHKPQGSPKNKVIFVFDGKPDVFDHKINSEYEIVFTKNETADDWIKRRVEKSAKRDNLILVSDDRLLSLSVRSQGAKAISVLGFFRIEEKKAKETSEDFKPELDPSVAWAITEELKKIWVEE